MKLTRLFKSTTLLCFSPPVMIGTIIIELSIALVVAVRYVIKTPQRLIIAILVFLAAFQIAEFHVCTTSPANLIWSRLGYAFITTLPPLGLHLVTKLRGEQRRVLVGSGYIMGAAFILAFSFLPQSLNAGVCTGNYVIFLLQQKLAMLYGAYYFGYELIALGLSVLPVAIKGVKRRPLLYMAAAYLSILVPTIIVYLILPATGIGIPSIMCGFAVILAVIVGLMVTPRISQQRSKSTVQ